MNTPENKPHHLSLVADTQSVNPDEQPHHLYMLELLQKHFPGILATMTPEAVLFVQESGGYIETECNRSAQAARLEEVDFLYSKIRPGYASFLEGDKIESPETRILRSEYEFQKKQPAGPLRHFSVAA